MSRTETTAMLSEQLERQVLSKFRLWGSEVKLREGDRFGAPEGGRVDYMAFEPLDMSCSVRSIEGGTVHVFEVKSCMADLKSGHGMNLVGDVNWLVCTADLWNEIIDKQVNVSGWKPLIWEWVKPGKFNPTSARYERHEITGRKMPVSQAMWLILRASGKAVSKLAAICDTCHVECFDDGVDEGLDGGWFSYGPPTWHLSCGHEVHGFERPRFCAACGRKVVEDDQD